MRNMFVALLLLLRDIIYLYCDKVSFYDRVIFRVKVLFHGKKEKLLCQIELIL